MAEHFLDTETRHALPLTAWRCLDAGLSLQQARGVWRHEVVPAVGFNARTPVGEWAGWDPDWLRQRIEAARARRPAWLWRRLDAWVDAATLGGIWPALAAFYGILERCAASERRPTAEALSTLARLWLFEDSLVDPLPPGPAALGRLRQLFPEPLSNALGLALLKEERRGDGPARVRAALEAAARDGEARGTE